MLAKQIQRVAEEVMVLNHHFSDVQVSDMVYSLIFGEYDGREAHKRNLALVVRTIS
jgi:hypothetical protein